MTVRDIRNNLEALPSLPPLVRATGTYSGASADLQGAGSAAVVVHYGAYTNGTHTTSLEHSDDNSTFATVGAAEMDGAFTAVATAGGANTVQRVGYRGAKRYLRAVMTVAGGATGAASSALILKSHPTTAPV